MAKCNNCYHNQVCDFACKRHGGANCIFFIDSSRMVELPCKQYDILWTYCTWPRTKVYSFCVTDVSCLNGGVHINTDTLGVIRGEDVGKTVFLTREEAEAELARRTANG